MEVILLQDVKSLGKKGNVVTVSDGYANNFLIPRKLAIIKTQKGLEILEKEKEDKRINDEKKIAKAKQDAEILKSITVEFEAASGKDGKMFGSISTKQIEDELKNKYDIVIDKRKIIDKYPVNVIGYTTLRIELAKDVIGELKILVREKK